MVKEKQEEHPDITQGSGEGITLENEMLGLRVCVISKQQGVKKLQQMAHDSLLFMMEKTPTRRPLGVD